MSHHEIPWQHAVYTRASKRDVFRFSHVVHSTIQKTFPLTLQVHHLRDMVEIKGNNAAAARKSAVLVLVTGKWAQNVSLEAYIDSKGDIDMIPCTPYDHLERMGAVRDGECSELTQEFRSMQYHSTLCNYTRGEGHTWGLETVVPVLSYVAIVPKFIMEDRLRKTMSSFNRAVKKSLADSLILVDGWQYKEDTMARKPVYILPESSPNISNLNAQKITCDCDEADSEKNQANQHLQGL